MITKVGRMTLVVSGATALVSCGHSSSTSAGKKHEAFSAPEVVETQWTNTAAQRTQTLLAANKIRYVLPAGSLQAKS